jgi:4-diphosphocytidyl-2-C-methyl-D-erythritol kinase
MPVLTEHVPAKLNLALHVRRRRADGYHDLETLFAFTAFGDTLRAAPADELTLSIDGEFAAAAGGGDGNLVLRAARALAQATGARAVAALSLTKRIPVAAGLGGGSADAAATLRLLDRLWETGHSRAWLTALGAELGADVPACVGSQTCYATGRGDALVNVDIGVAGLPVLLINPRVAVPTGPVFAGWNGIDLGPLDAACDLRALRNDLTAPAVRLVPAIAAMLAWLERQDGLVLARMSGSGGSVFGIFGSMACAAAAAKVVPDAWWSVYTTLRRPGGDGGPQ